MAGTRDAAKIHTKLQMYLGESVEQNLVRAECASQLVVKSSSKKYRPAWGLEKICRPEHLTYQHQVPMEPEILSTPIELEPLSGRPRPFQLDQPEEAQAEIEPGGDEPLGEEDRREIEANVFISLTEPDDGAHAAEMELPEALTENLTARRGGLVAATVPLTRLDELRSSPSVAYVEPAEPLKDPDFKVTESDEPEREPVPRFGSADQRQRIYDGEPRVLIGIVDVGGFDFAHPDFLRSGGTRFDSIWDQGGRMHAPPPEYDYGSVLTTEHMNAAIEASKELGLAPYLLEPQSQMTPGSHGTHVASIAAGNGGVCPNSVLAGVLVSLPRDELRDRRRSFYDSTRLAHAVEYLLALGRKRGLPVSINISLGTNGHAHDASSAINRWIDHALATPGRAVTVAAGNAGQQRAEHATDLGWMSGRIHTSGRLAARGLMRDVDWIVAGNGTVDYSENELELWYSPQDRFSVKVRTPEGTWSEEVRPGEFFRNRRLPDGSRLSIFNQVYHPANGANYIAVYLSPNLQGSQPVGVPSGKWTVRLTGEEVRDGRYHGWIERDDPRRIGRVGDRPAWSLPSFFSERSNVDNSSVGSLACGHNIISVGNLDRRRERMHISSSQGPTRDGRHKPEVAAPGTEIVAAKGFTRKQGEGEWTAMTGTSMASPYVAGVVGLILADRRELTASQIRGIIQSSANPLPGNDYSWQDDAGYGVIDPKRCLQDAGVVGRHNNLDPPEPPDREET